MAKVNYPAFHRRQANRQAELANIVGARRSESRLAKAAQASQVVLVLLAAFGYFYTVQPVYQKERLAEEVAKSQAILEAQRVELKANSSHLLELREERKSLVLSLQNLETDLARSESKRREIEEATAFMTYKHYLPDGTPAKTVDEVRRAVLHENVREFKSFMELRCGRMGLLFGPGNLFPAVREYKVGNLDEAWTEHFPYSKEELDMWEKHKKSLPKLLAVSCARELAAQFSSSPRLADYPLRPALEKSIDQVVSKIEESPGDNWNTIEEPKDVVKSCKSKRKKIEVGYRAELKAIDDEFRGWESAWGASRREILRHNYGVEKTNARNSALSKLWETESECRSKAEALGTEVVRQLKIHVVGKGGE